MPARRPRPARTPRGSLSRDKVLAAALELARGGLDAVSMRALGARLGADPTAVYRYFRTKDELLDAMADAVVAGDRPVPQTGRRPRTSPPPSRTSAGHCWPTPP